jgi:hypothetical protein
MTIRGSFGLVIMVSLCFASAAFAHDVLETPTSAYANYQITANFRGPYVVKLNETNAYKSNHIVAVNKHQSCDIFVYGELYLNDVQKADDWETLDVPVYDSWSSTLQYDTGVVATGRGKTSTLVIGSTPEEIFVASDSHNVVWIP